jgi:hypothetical protein
LGVIPLAKKKKKKSFILYFFSRRPVKFASGVPNVVALDFLFFFFLGLKYSGGTDATEYRMTA